MKRARLTESELEYEIKGAGEPVLLIHGSHVARSFVPLLEQKVLTDEYMLIRYHRRGWLGSSSPEGELSIARQAADAAELLAFLGIERAHVVGHSYGGAITLELAHDFPERVHSLALMEAALVSVPKHRAVRELIRVAGRMYEQGDWDAAEDWFLGTPQERADIMRNIPGGLEQALEDMDTFFGFEAPAHEVWKFGDEQGTKIHQPVLFMLGGESSPLYVQCNDAVRAWMPQTETVILPGASHLLHIQDPDGAALLLRNFFSRHPMPAPLARGAPADGGVRRRARTTDAYNAATDLLDGNLERGRADKVAVRTHGAEWTYGEVAELVNRMGNALRGLGVEAENRVLLAMPDTMAFVAAFFGALKIGAVPIPVSPVLHAEEYAWRLADSRAKAAVVAEPVAAALREGRVKAPRLIVTGRSGPEELGFDELVAAADEELSPADTRRDDVGFWLYSSGTTGRPKGVVHLQHHMRYCVEAYGKHVLAIDESDTTFSVSRLHFAFGLGGGLYYPFSAGATTVLIAEPPQPRVVLNATGEFHPTILFGVPTSYASLLSINAWQWRSADLDNVRLCLSGGEALGGALLARWKERTGLDILEGMGCTEACHTFISNRAGDVRPNSCGTVVEGYEVKLVDAEGREVSAGKPGLLAVKGGSICAYYWHDHELTKATVKGEWLQTGDTFVQDEAGRFYFRGRVDDMLKVAGTWVSPREIEQVLGEHDRVASSAVVGVADADGLVRPEAYVVLDVPGGEQQLEGALRHWVRQRLGSDKTPRAIYFVPKLPDTPSRQAERAKVAAVTLTTDGAERDSSLV
ncbi:MAG: benzoate-CoA ligase family protein [Solirubrobacterales bacterium]|nr:benzoate-CoA ligase family protein [Solirubrobacterales bacterium]